MILRSFKAGNLLGVDNIYSIIVLVLWARRGNGLEELDEQGVSCNK